MADKDKKTKQEKDSNLRKEMTDYQKGYEEGIYTQKKYPKGISDLGNKINRLLMSEDEKKGQDKGIEDIKKAKEYKKKNMKKGGMVKKHRGDGCAVRGKTKGRFV